MIHPSPPSSNRYSATFDDNRISKDMLMDLNKVYVELRHVVLGEGPLRYHRLLSVTPFWSLRLVSNVGLSPRKF